MTRLTRAGAESGAMALPLTSRAFLNGLQSLLFMAMPPEVLAQPALAVPRPTMPVSIKVTPRQAAKKRP
jgi:hypothetical protein